MHIFEPPQTLLSKIGEPIEFRWRAGPADMTPDELDAYTARLVHDVYELNEKRDDFGPLQRAWVDGPNELLWNAWFHPPGTTGRTITFAFGSGTNRYIVGCHDGGDYFTSPDVKKAWESREYIPSTPAQARPFKNGNSGHRRIMDRNDQIYVDTEQSALWILPQRTGERWGLRSPAGRKKEIEKYRSEGLYERISSHIQTF